MSFLPSILLLDVLQIMVQPRPLNVHIRSLLWGERGEYGGLAQNRQKLRRRRFCL